MPFLLLLLLAIACWPDSWPRPFWAEGLGLSGWSFALLTWSAMVLMMAAAGWLTGQARRGLLYFPNKREAIFERYSRGRFRHLLSLLVIYGLAVYLLGWGWTVRSLGPAMSPEDFIKKFSKNQQAVVQVEDLPSELAIHLTPDDQALCMLDQPRLEQLLRDVPYRHMFPVAELFIL